MSVAATCPGCAAAITFRTGTLINVCEFCGAVVARRDRSVENLGKVADLVQTQSPLALHVRGRWRNADFELVGRAQLRHQAGGVWDEWYAAFDDGRWGWLAEAQGRFYLTFAVPADAHGPLPPFDQLTVGAPIPMFPGATSMIAAEKGTAVHVSARGEVPYALAPGGSYQYVDAAGEGGAFGTLHYDNDASTPEVYAGRQVTLEEIGLGQLAPADHAPRDVKADRIACPNCDGNLELRAPDQTQRVCCQFCGMLSAVSEGKLSKLHLVNIPKPVIPLGTTGKIGGGTFTVIGCMEKSATFDGVRYAWSEYLLYEPRAGFRWLVQSDRHWSFVEPLPPGEAAGSEATATYQGRTFKTYQSSIATVEQVVGEFYWQVEAGEVVSAIDYILPPHMLSCETTDNEVAWSLGTWMSVDAVEQAFGVKDLPRSSKAAPNQPYPHPRFFRAWGILFAVALVLGLGVNRRSAKVVTTQTFPLASAGDEIVFSEPFQLAARENIRVTLATRVDNSWLFVEGDFVHEDSGYVQSFDTSIERYSGVEGGEAWQEGGNTRQLVLGAPDVAGTYVLRLELQKDPGKPSPDAITVAVQQRVPRFGRLFWLLCALSLPAVMMFFHRRGFEKERWADSDHSPYAEDE